MAGMSPFEQAIAHIKSHWRKGENLTEIALKFKVDAGNLTRSFRTIEGKTVKQFIDAKRKEYVVEKLRENSHFGYQIGVDLGFTNDFSFYRWVKRAFGVSFKELRKKI